MFATAAQIRTISPDRGTPGAGDSSVLLQSSLWLCEGVILSVIKQSIKSALQALTELDSSLHPWLLSQQKLWEQQK